VAQRLTDKITEAIARAANALTVYTRANQGLPIVMVKALSVAASTTSTLTFTVATDCWVNGITTNVTTAAFVLVNDARVTRIEVAGFLLFEDQGTQCPFFYDATSGRSGYETAENFKGYATPFRLRQGDVLSVTCQNDDASNAAIVSAKIDAYRVSTATVG
jgi:hypothetical protein